MPRYFPFISTFRTLRVGLTYQYLNLYAFAREQDLRKLEKNGIS